jgi:phage-related protein
MATFTLSTPDQGATKSLKPRLRVSRFGDGYDQRVPDGLNYMLESWSLNFSGKTKAQVLAIETFFTTHGGHTAFDWTTPDGVLKKFVCQEWKTTPSHDLDWSISCTFEQRPA